MQVCAEVAIVILDENTPASRSWFTWRDILHLVDIICCCAILFPIVWSIKHLREAAGVSNQPQAVCLQSTRGHGCLADSCTAASCSYRPKVCSHVSLLLTLCLLVQTDGKAARNLLKLQLFRQFYVMVVVYIYFTRIVVYLLRSTMPYQYAWLPDAAGKVFIISLCTCVVQGLLAMSSHCWPIGWEGE